MDEAQIRTASPTNIDASLEYITVDKYQWPKYELPKRARLDEEERRRRHREGQRQFMSRKRCRIGVLRREMASVELQLQWVKAREEQKNLEAEHRQLLKRLYEKTRPEFNGDDRATTGATKKETFVGPAESEVMDVPDMENLLFEVLLSW